jgi:hypothetical protein
VVIALVAAGWFAPTVCGLAATLHLHGDHEHAALPSADALESLLHGHFHDAATPQHTHAFWFTPAAPRPARADAPAVSPAIEPDPPASDCSGLAGTRSVGEPGERSAPLPLSLLHCALLN